MKKLILLIIIIASSFILYTSSTNIAVQEPILPAVTSTPASLVVTPDLIAPTTTPTETTIVSTTPPQIIPTEKQPQLLTKSTLQNVPFTSQAPTGHWSDLRQEDGCEEASTLMAVTWARKQKLGTNAENEKKIIELADWQTKNFNNYHDTSISDTATRILKGYFEFTSFEVKNNINLDDIKQALALGKIIIAPMNGIKLGNPNFTAPGPEHHMLVIIGYDPATKEFITNDPGTRKGRQYRYSEKIIEQAIRDYPTGIHLPVREIRKNIIVVSMEK